MRKNGRYFRYDLFFRIIFSLICNVKHVHKHSSPSQYVWFSIKWSVCVCVSLCRAFYCCCTTICTQTVNKSVGFFCSYILMWYLNCSHITFCRFALTLFSSLLLFGRRARFNIIFKSEMSFSSPKSGWLSPDTQHIKSAPRMRFTTT